MNNEIIQQINFFNQSADISEDKTNVIIYFLKNLLVSVYLQNEFVITVVFVGRRDIYEMNKKYLKHDYETDIITFDFTEDFGVFSGDLYVCPELAFENAQRLGVDQDEELVRVICHGILHLIGYNDKTEEDITEIRVQEERCLEYFRNAEKY